MVALGLIYLLQHGLELHNFELMSGSSHPDVFSKEFALKNLT